jgi:predicted aspartyl protease
VPILSIQFSGQAKTTGGAVVSLPPALALAGRGPCVQITLGLVQAMAAPLLQQGKSVPQPVSGIGLIDSGASHTCIDDAAAVQLGLPVRDVVTVASASHAATRQNVYPAQIEIVGLPIAIAAKNAIGAPLAAQGLLALIGRDVLQHCTLFYNGPSGSITLSL